MESGSAVHVHPVVLASIVDAYERRGLESEGVIGTLLGEIYFFLALLLKVHGAKA